MSWTERQQAMLREMGLRVWAPAAEEPTAEIALSVTEAPAGPTAAPLRAQPVAAPATTSAPSARRGAAV